MDGKPLDELYLRWLYSQVGLLEESHKELSYWKLFRQLYKTEFLWIIPKDDNRLEDGIALRREFRSTQAIDDSVEPDWTELGCSFLELMVGLSRRLEFEAGGQAHYWFWRLMENIGLRSFHDGIKRYPRIYIDGILHSIIFRQYNSSGLGGFFPLQEPREDQRNVELWYQLNAYVLEQT